MYTFILLANCVKLEFMCSIAFFKIRPFGVSTGLTKATSHYATKLHATNCNKAVTKLEQSCNTLVTTLLQFVACNFVV